jgi:cytolysin-activating lysine-acyltransferase
MGQSVNGTAKEGESTAPAAQQASGTSAGAGKAGTEPSTLQLKQRRIAAKARAAALGEIVSVLAQAENAKQRPLSDLQWMVLPALMTGQFRIGEGYSQTGGFSAPAGVMLWASVSDEVDQRLSADPETPIRLAPQEWKSGDNLWLIEATGSPRILAGLLKNLAEKEWKGKQVKMRSRGADGKFVIHVIDGAAAAA